jgi:hypothetical protein
MKRILRSALSLCLASAVAISIAAPARAADRGLYGSTDPTYDGVLRQSLALMGLTSVDLPPAPSAVTWLLGQQCADGSFQAYRKDTTVPCTASNPTAFSGPDVNSTAAAATALALVGEQSAARKAVVWLNEVQNDDWGWPYYVGGESDANSTALAIVALRTVSPQDRSARVPNAIGYLTPLQFPCGSASAGALPYQAGGAANSLASSEAIAGVGATLPIDRAGPLKRNPPCGKAMPTRLASYLASQITAKGALTSDLGTGQDLGSTARAVIGLSGLGVGRAAVRIGTRTLTSTARDFALKGGVANPGAIGLLLMVAEATGTSPRNFGGVNLVSALTGSMR